MRKLRLRGRRVTKLGSDVTRIRAGTRWRKQDILPGGNFQRVPESSYRDRYGRAIFKQSTHILNKGILSGFVLHPCVVVPGNSCFQTPHGFSTHGQRILPGGSVKAVQTNLATQGVTDSHAFLLEDVNNFLTWFKIWEGMLVSEYRDKRFSFYLRLSTHQDSPPGLNPKSLSLIVPFW